MSREAPSPAHSALALQSTDVHQRRPLTNPGRVIGRQFLTFAAVGAVGTAAHYATLVLLVEALRTSPIVGTTIGFVCGAVVNYLLNRRFTFASARNHQTALPQFLCVAALGAGLNYVAVATLTSWPGVHYLVAQAIATCFVLLWNFLANRYWTFRI